MNGPLMKPVRFNGSRGLWLLMSECGAEEALKTVQAGGDHG